jgi:hypothetical protein
MAFVYRSERKTDMDPVHVANNLGPGAYVGHKNYQLKPKYVRILMFLATTHFQALLQETKILFLNQPPNCLVTMKA